MTLSHRSLITVILVAWLALAHVPVGVAFPVMLNVATFGAVLIARLSGYRGAIPPDLLLLHHASTTCTMGIMAVTVFMPDLRGAAAMAGLYWLVVLILAWRRSLRQD